MWGDIGRLDGVPVGHLLRVGVGLRVRVRVSVSVRVWIRVKG